MKLKVCFAILMLVLAFSIKGNARILFSSPAEKPAAEKVERFYESLNIPLPKTDITITRKDMDFLGYTQKGAQQISLRKQLTDTEVQVTLAHELIHVIRHNTNINEEIWLDEGLGKLMEYLYSHVWPVSYNDRLKNSSFFALSKNEKDFSPNGIGYVHSFLLMHYLYQHFGENEFLKEVLNSRESGWTNILTALERLKKKSVITYEDTYLTKESILRHFAVALLLNDAFTAKYAFFQLHAFYDPIMNYVNLPILKGKTSSGDYESQIIYSTQPLVGKFQEVWGVASWQPFEIERPRSGSNYIEYIQIR